VDDLSMTHHAASYLDGKVSLAVGFIDNAGIAYSLSQRIRAAQDASGQATTHIASHDASGRVITTAAQQVNGQDIVNLLNAFKNEVKAQSGEHITDIAAQLLLQDADSLIS
jgi:hypothetical protein